VSPWSRFATAAGVLLFAFAQAVGARFDDSAEFSSLSLTYCFSLHGYERWTSGPSSWMIAFHSYDVFPIDYFGYSIWLLRFSKLLAAFSVRGR